MPKPPSFDPVTDIKFITNYFLAGCSPPQHLIVEFSGPPSQELLKMLIVPNLEDIVQNIFDPRMKRERKPNRHNHKRGKRRGLPDVDELIAGQLRSTLNEGNILDFGPLRKAFTLWNMVERLNFTAAIVEMSIDIPFQTIWGILSVDNGHCREFARLSQSGEGYGIVGGAGPEYYTFTIPDVDFNVGFIPGQFRAESSTGPCTVNLRATAFNDTAEENITGGIYLATAGGAVKAESGIRKIPPLERVDFEVNAQFEKGESFEWGWRRGYGYCMLGEKNITAFATQDWPWPFK